jgi:hypothetical protein
VLASLLVPATRAAPLVLPALKIDDTSLKSPPVFALVDALDVVDAVDVTDIADVF